MIIAHGPLSTLLTERYRERFLRKVDGKIIPISIIIAFIAGILPDFDFFILAAQSKPAFIHHTLITHTPIFWAITSILTYLVLILLQKYGRSEIGRVLDNGGKELITAAVFIGTISHIFADLLTGHIMLLYPFSQYGFSLTTNLFTINPTVSYIFHPIFILELFIVILFTHHLIKNLFLINNQHLKLFIQISISTLTFLLFLFSYIYLNTYNPVMPRDGNNMINYDIDNDGIIDFKDPDTNDNGFDNIEDVRREIVVQNIDRIIERKPLATSNNSLLEKMGYLTSYSLISTAYFESGYPIEPVIKRRLDSKEYNLQSYYLTLKENGDIGKLNTENISNSYWTTKLGYTLFVIEEEKVIQAGVILRNSTIVTIEGMDRRVRDYDLKEFLYLYNSNGVTFEIER